MEKKLYLGLKTSDLIDTVFVQITMPSGDYRDVYSCYMGDENQVKQMQEIFNAYTELELNGKDVKFGPHGECIDVKYIMHDKNGIVTEIELFELTENEYLNRIEKEEGNLLN